MNDKLARAMLVDDIRASIKGEIGIEKSKTGEFAHPSNWTPDYHEGFIDGLKRSLELINEETGD